MLLKSTFTLVLNHNGIIQKTTNTILYYGNTKLYLQGIVGFKNGFTDEAGYFFTGTAKKDGKRRITVFMGTRDKCEQFTETKKLLAYGFQEFALYIPFLKKIKSSLESIFKIDLPYGSINLYMYTSNKYLLEVYFYGAKVMFLLFSDRRPLPQK